MLWAAASVSAHCAMSSRRVPSATLLKPPWTSDHWRRLPPAMYSDSI